MKISSKNTSKQISHGGLCLKRREGESITIEGTGKLTFTVMKAEYGTSVLVFTDGKEFKILRSELLERDFGAPSPL